MTNMAPERARRPAIKFAHAVLKTRDHYEKMKEFYCTALDGEIVFGDERTAFVRFDDEHHRLLILNSPNSDVPKSDMIGLDHLAYTFGSLGDLLAAQDRLGALGYQTYCPINHGLTHALYYKDPDGNRVELQVDNFSNMDDAVEFMTSTYGVNPIGTSFDPDEYRERLRNGESEESILRPPADYKPEPYAPELFARLKS